MAKFKLVNLSDKTGYLNIEEVLFIQQPKDPEHSFETIVLLRNGESLTLNENYRELLEDWEIEFPANPDNK